MSPIIALLHCSPLFSSSLHFLCPCLLIKQVYTLTVCRQATFYCRVCFVANRGPLEWNCFVHRKLLGMYKNREFSAPLYYWICSIEFNHFPLGVLTVPFKARSCGVLALSCSCIYWLGAQDTERIKQFDITSGEKTRPKACMTWLTKHMLIVVKLNYSWREFILDRISVGLFFSERDCSDKACCYSILVKLSWSSNESGCLYLLRGLCL